MSEQFDEDYFLYGKQSKKSLYEDYTWMPELTIPMVQVIVAYLGISWNDSVLDFGCARGYVVKAFRELGYIAYGMDVSEWAIHNADEETKPYLNWTANGAPLLHKEFDWVITKDVLEHIPCVKDTIDRLLDTTRVGMFVVVPLSEVDDEKYVVRCYEKDVTHIHRLTLATWAAMFMRPGWSVQAQYRVHGVKDNYSRYPKGNGFLTIRRVQE